MANRAYLYSLDNRPADYSDRPEKICGLSEWNYGIPFSYRVLMSGHPQLCASLISDGFEDDKENAKTRLYAISAEFEKGHARLKKLLAVVAHIATHTATSNPPVSVPLTPLAQLKEKWKHLFSKQEISPLNLPAPHLAESIRQTHDFLSGHANPYLLLETIELDLMDTDEENALRAHVENEIARCIQTGQAVDALPDNTEAAAPILLQAARNPMPAPLDAFFGLRFDDDCDNLADKKTEYPLGLEWHDDLYYGLFNREEFEKNLKETRK